MAQIAKASKATQKRVAFQQKQKDSGNNVVKWIFAALIALALLFVVYSVFIVS